MRRRLVLVVVAGDAGSLSGKNEKKFRAENRSTELSVFPSYRPVFVLLRGRNIVVFFKVMD